MEVRKRGSDEKEERRHDQKNKIAGELGKDRLKNEENQEIQEIQEKRGRNTIGGLRICCLLITCSLEPEGTLSLDGWQRGEEEYGGKL